MDDHEIYDARKPTRTHGPYDDAKTAQAAADILNKFIFDNSVGKVLGEPAEIVGPYYVRPVEQKPKTDAGLTLLFDAAQDPHLETASVR